MAVRARLDAQVFRLGALAGRVAEGLVAAGEILRRPVLIQVLVPGGGLQREVRIREVRPRQRHQIGLARREQRVDLVRRSHGTDSHGRDADFIAHPVGIRRLVHAPIDWPLVRHGLSGGHVDEIAARVF